MAVWTLLVVVTGIAVLAVLISTRFGISAAIVEIILGVLAANVFGVTNSGAVNAWLPMFASLGGVLLTFLAGSEIDTEEMRRAWKASLSIGVVSFLAPFMAAWAVADLVLRWSWDASILTGVALSDTSVAIVYLVLVEGGTSRSAAGKIILSSCFVTGLGTAFALSLLFIQPNAYLIPLVIATALAVLALPALYRWLLPKLRGLPGEPEVKILVFTVVFLGALAQLAGAQAVLPAYVLGLALAVTLGRHRDVLLKLRTLTLAFLTPFFFINAGLGVSLAAVASGVAIVVLLFGVKVGAKIAGVFPLARRLEQRDAVYISLLMSTGLTFGTIAATYGLAPRPGGAPSILSQSQYSVVLMVVLLTAMVPTLIAQRWFRPAPGPTEGASA